MKKVVMLLDNDFLSDNRVEKEAISLIRAGYSVEVVCLTSTTLPPVEARNSIQITRIIEPLIYTRPFSPQARHSLPGLVEAIEKRDFDYVHCHDYNLVHVGKELKRRRPTLTAIYDSHECFALFPFYRSARGLRNKLKTYLVWRSLLWRERTSARHYDALIATTPYIVERLGRSFKIPNRIALRNIPERQSLKPGNYLREFFKLEADSIVIAHTGNIYFPPAYIDTIERSLGKLGRRAHLVFLVDPARSRGHRAFVAEHGLQDRIHFLDYPPREKSLEYLSSASIGLCWVNTRFKSQVYSSANRYWEYTMAQLPVVSNRQSEVTDEFKKFDNGVLFSDGQNGLASALMRVLSDYDAYKANAIAASRGASWEQESEKLIRLYAGLTPTERSNRHP